MSNPVLTARDVSVALDGQQLLPRTSLVVTPGEAVAVRGPNGAGKTTLLRVLAGLTPPTAGEVLLGERPLDSRAHTTRQQIAALIGAPSIAPNLTLSEQLRYVRATWGASSTTGEREAAALLEEFGIPTLRDRYAHELSSGQTQLFHLTLAFARPGDVRILDEPEQRLDASRRELVAAAFRARMSEGAAVVFATHSGSLARAAGARQLSVGSPE